MLYSHQVTSKITFDLPLTARTALTDSQVDQDPVPLSRLIRFALDLPLAQSVYHRKTGTFLHRDELVSW